MCNYSLSISEGNWQLLSRSDDRCDPAIELRSESVAAGEQVKVPSADGLITVEVVDAPGADRQRLEVYCDAQGYSLKQPIPTGPLVVAGQDGLGWDSSQLPPSCESISFGTDAQIVWRQIPLKDSQ